MTTSLRDLGERAGRVPAPQLDVAAVVAAGESRLRRRRATAVAAVAAVVAAVLSAAVLLAPGARLAAPPPAHDRTHAPDDGDTVETRPASRLLTYSVGTVIHWGDRTIDVGQVARGRQPRRTSLDYLDATDDGVVFITGPQLKRDESGQLGIGYGASAVWFTDGSTPVRIGTTSGSAVRGFGIGTSLSGSTLAWKEPGDESSETLADPFGPVVVYDTGQKREVARFGGADAEVLTVYDDVVYWSSGDAPCAIRSDFGCYRPRWVMRFEKASGLQAQVGWADYEADRRSRPGVLTGPYVGDARVEGPVSYEFIGFVRRGGRLFADGGEPGAVFTPTVALTGRPVRLRMPAGDRTSDALAISQWLDADRVVLVAPHSYSGADGTELLVCRLSTGGCRLAARFPDANYTEAGPAGIHG
jgi:hypothetical protein